MDLFKKLSGAWILFVFIAMLTPTACSEYGNERKSPVDYGNMYIEAMELGLSHDEIVAGNHLLVGRGFMLHYHEDFDGALPTATIRYFISRERDLNIEEAIELEPIESVSLKEFKEYWPPNMEWHVHYPPGVPLGHMTVHIPPGIDPGQYYLYAVGDYENVLAGNLEDKTVRSDERLSVLAPSAENHSSLWIPSMRASRVAMRGGEGSKTFLLENQGNIDVENVEIEIYLIDEDSFDVRLGQSFGAHQEVALDAKPLTFLSSETFESLPVGGYARFPVVFPIDMRLDVGQYTYFSVVDGRVELISELEIKEGIMIEAPANMSPGGSYQGLLRLTRPVKEGEALSVRFSVRPEGVLEIPDKVRLGPGTDTMPFGIDVTKDPKRIEETYDAYLQEKSIFISVEGDGVGSIFDDRDSYNWLNYSKKILVD